MVSKYWSSAIISHLDDQIKVTAYLRIRFFKNNKNNCWFSRYLHINWATAEYSFVNTSQYGIKYPTTIQINKAIQLNIMSLKYHPTSTSTFVFI